MSPDGDDEGWRWRVFRNATHPSFWVASAHPDMVQFIGGSAGHPYQTDDGHARAGSACCFKLRTIFDIVDMPWDWPAEVNYLEASAFLRWKAATEALASGAAPASYRMPTEAEYHALRCDPSPFAEATPPPRDAPGGALAGGGAATGAKLAPGSQHHGADSLYHGGKVALPAGCASESEARCAGAAAREAGKGGEAGGGAHAAAGAVDVIMQPTAPGNINMRWHSCTPVDMYGPSPAGFFDAHGNGAWGGGWEGGGTRQRLQC